MKWMGAILMNALVFPGSGHIMIGAKVKGYVICSLVSIFVLLPLIGYSIATLTALFYLPQDASLARSITAMHTAWLAQKSFILSCLLVIAIIWLYGIVDILFLKYKKDRSS